VLLLATAFGTYLLYRQLEDQAMQRLSLQAAERARVAPAWQNQSSARWGCRG
jgi:hypothetical protein